MGVCKEIAIENVIDEEECSDIYLVADIMEKR